MRAKSPHFRQPQITRIDASVLIPRSEQEAIDEVVCAVERAEHGQGRDEERSRASVNLQPLEGWSKRFYCPAAARHLRRLRERRVERVQHLAATLCLQDGRKCPIGPGLRLGKRTPSRVRTRERPNDPLPTIRMNECARNVRGSA